MNLINLYKVNSANDFFNLARQEEELTTLPFLFYSDNNECVSPTDNDCRETQKCVNLEGSYACVQSSASKGATGKDSLLQYYMSID